LIARAARFDVTVGDSKTSDELAPSYLLRFWNSVLDDANLLRPGNDGDGRSERGATLNET
jgi:hypothetical protein